MTDCFVPGDFHDQGVTLRNTLIQDISFLASIGRVTSNPSHPASSTLGLCLHLYWQHRASASPALLAGHHTSFQSVHHKQKLKLNKQLIRSPSASFRLSQEVKSAGSEWPHSSFGHLGAGPRKYQQIIGVTWKENPTKGLPTFHESLKSLYSPL